MLHEVYLCVNIRLFTFCKVILKFRIDMKQKLTFFRSGLLGVTFNPVNGS